MNREKIIKLAREADMDVDHAESNAWGAIITAEPADLERFAALAAAAEREECAKTCEKDGLLWGQRYAAAIRERGVNDT